jgi:hypothetical protein
VNAELFGILSGSLVALSALPYGWRAWQKEIKPNITTWFLWSIIGLTLLLTYRDSGAGSNLWPAVFGFINPCIIAAIAIIKRGEWEPLTLWEKASGIGCLISLALWYVVKDSKELAQYALYLSILADLCAAMPTILFVWKKPHEDRPGAWAIFAVAYGLAIFAITEHTFANYALPVYMFLGALFGITLPLARYRLKQGAPILQWI